MTPNENSAAENPATASEAPSSGSSTTSKVETVLTAVAGAAAAVAPIAGPAVSLGIQLFNVLAPLATNVILMVKNHQTGATTLVAQLDAVDLQVAENQKVIQDFLAGKTTGAAPATATTAA